VDLDLGLSEAICQLFPIIGIFPPGDSGFPVSPIRPFLYGVVPQQVTFDVDDRIPNGISLSPVELGLVLDVDPADPENAGEVCELSFAMEGTILPVQAPVPGEIHAAMVQGLRELSLSLVSEGQCVHQFTSSADRDLMTFNYVARK
jgi:hypothetical protein